MPSLLGRGLLSDKFNWDLLATHSHAFCVIDQRWIAIIENRWSRSTPLLLRTVAIRPIRTHYLCLLLAVFDGDQIDMWCVCVYENNEFEFNWFGGASIYTVRLWSNDNGHGQLPGFWLIALAKAPPRMPTMICPQPNGSIEFIYLFIRHAFRVDLPNKRECMFARAHWLIVFNSTTLLFGSRKI